MNKSTKNKGIEERYKEFLEKMNISKMTDNNKILQHLYNVKTNRSKLTMQDIDFFIKNYPMLKTWLIFGDKTGSTKTEQVNLDEFILLNSPKS